MMRREDTGRGSTLKLFWPLGGIRKIDTACIALKELTMGGLLLLRGDY
jgi:hypothetical protein